MPFVYKGNLNPNGGRQLMEFTLASSATFTVGDAMVLANASLGLAAIGGLITGVLAGFKKSDGSPLTDNGAGGDFTADTYTTPASNTVLGVIDVSPDSIYSCNADATLGTTTNSDKAGFNFDIMATADQIDESTVVATTAQFYSFGPDPSAATTRILCKIQESQIKI